MKEERMCQNCKLTFLIEDEDFQFYKKMNVPSPTWCPECRLIRRMIWRNEKIFYKRKDAHSGESIFTMFHPDVQIKIYEHSYWWSDFWDGIDYGRDYDFNKPFFEQFEELLKDVPWFSRSANDIVNSEYAMTSGYLKNCYMVFDSDHAEGCSYCVGLVNTKDSIDNLLLLSSELCYGTFACANVSRAFYSIDCNQSSDIWFCEECEACSNCVGCRNLRHKQYCILNKQYTKEEFQKEFEKLQLHTRSGRDMFAKRFAEFSLKFPIKSMLESHNTNCTGDFVTYSKNVKESYLVRGGENLKYCQSLYTPPGSRDCYDYTIWGQNAERIYECCQVGGDVSNIAFGAWLYPNCSGVRYSVACPFSSNIFGCFGLKRKQYCILNKQYTKEEYEKLLPKIIEHMNDIPYVDKLGRIYKFGEFFPPELSPFAYNETIAQDFFPLSKTDAEKRGYTWRDGMEKQYNPTLSWKDIPDSIKDVDDSILNQIILCRSWDENQGHAIEHNCTKAFRITPEELQFYRRLNIPIPDCCFYSRHYERAKHRNPIKLWSRKCMCGGINSEGGVYENTVTHEHGDRPCGEPFETSYASDRPEIVYCDKCFWKEFL
ncbi:MAG: hypothetical protein AB1333_01865 [Patescibacteria group bacterium]